MQTKNIIIGIAIILFGGGLGYWQYDKAAHPEKYVVSATPTTSTTTEGHSQQTTGTLGTVVANEKIVVDTPIGGKMMGVIEVGASGFNSFVVNMDSKGNWELHDKQFGESLAYEGFATTEDVKSGIKKYLSAIFIKGVSGRNVHFVMSSGALKNKKTELIAKAIEQMGYVVNRMTADQEGKFALKALLPKSYKNNGFVVDMGSGNTKISWYDTNGNLKTVETFGAKYYQDNNSDTDVYKAVAEAVKTIPQANREYAFFIGGIPFEMANEDKTTDRFTFLRTPDTYSGGDSVKKKSGINIYTAIIETSSPRVRVFDWDANFTIGFLTSLK